MKAISDEFILPLKEGFQNGNRLLFIGTIMPLSISELLG